MEFYRPRYSHPPRSAFSLIEMVVVIAITSTLLVAGVSLLGDTGAKARRASSDSLAALIEQGRTAAITTRSQVMLAVAEPGDLPSGDDRCRLGLFKLTEFDEKTGKAKGELMRRWVMVDTGVVLLGGQAENFRNVVDERSVSLTYTSAGKTFDLAAQGIIFNPRGGREWPQGAGAVVMRIAEGTYRGPGKKAEANKRGEDKTIAEDRLKIGRVIARAHRLDP